MPRQQEKDEQQRPLTQNYDELADGSESDLTDIPLERHRRRSRWQPSTCCLAFLFLLTSILSMLLGAILAFQSINLDKECALHTTQYSPLLKDVDVRYEMTPFNGSFMAETIYRQEASPEVDKAWEDLGVDSRAGIIAYEEGLKAGLTKHHVQVADKYGGGFFVNVEGMHHLHCLNLVRKGLWFNYDYYKKLGHHAFQNDEFILRKHATHCLDTVRQVLMCNADTGVLGQVWYDPQDVRAFPDFKTQHKCKNFDAIRQWAVDHQAPPEDKLPDDYMRAPQGDDILPAQI